MENDFFDGMTPKVGEFFSFKKVGDSVQGTYIDRRDGMDGYGNEQFIYVLQDNKHDKTWNVGVKKTSINLIRQMEQVPYGFIVGFRFDEERENKKRPGLHPTKIINAYYNTRDTNNPKFVDHDWLNTQKQLGRSSFTPDSSSLPLVVTDTSSDSDDEFEKELEDLKGEAPGAPEVDLGPVRKLAVTKGLVEANAPEAEMDAIISAYAGLPLTAKNIKDVVMAITKFKK
jgi:hypothetical protein